MKRHVATWSSTLAIALTVCAVGQQSASAQTNSLFGSRGPASQIGTNLNGSRAGLGNTQSGPTFLGLDGQALGGAGQPGAAGNFIGRGDNADRFVGDQRLQQFGQGGNAGRNSRNFGNRGGGGNRNANAGGRGASQSGKRKRAAIRPRQRIAFSYPARHVETLNVELTLRLRRVALMQTELAGVEVTVDESGVATITGTVDTPQQRRLAELFIRLEPGVRSIRNELATRGVMPAE